jgi:hypothetical protein
MVTKTKTEVTAVKTEAKTEAKTATAEKLQPLCGERQPGESDLAVSALNDFLLLGSGRTLTRLLAQYVAQRPRETPQNPVKTRSLNTLQGWSKQFAWFQRAADYDVLLDEKYAGKLQREVDTGYSMPHVRLRTLKRVAGRLEREIFEKGIFLTDTRVDDKGRTSESERYNSAIVNDLRGLLDDIAKERGGRKPYSFLVALLQRAEKRLDLGTFTEEQIDRMRTQKLHWLQIILEPYLLPEENK